MESGLQPRDGRSPRCHACHFDLTGLPASDGTHVTCPECGQPVLLEQAYRTARERAAEWLQEPAQPTPARFLLTTFIMLLAGGTVLLLILAAIYFTAMMVSAWSARP